MPRQRLDRGPAPVIDPSDDEVRWIRAYRIRGSAYARCAYRAVRDTIGRTQLETALTARGELLVARGLHYQVILVGGGNLILRGLLSRPTTKDLNILGARTPDGVAQLRPMPEPLHDAVVDVGRAFELADDWLNTGPDSLLGLGPPGPVRRGGSNAGTITGSWRGWRAGSTWCASALRRGGPGPTKPALAGPPPTLGPGRDDLLAAARWATSHDPSPGFRSLDASLG